MKQLLSETGAGGESVDRPNILWIGFDQIRADTLARGITTSGGAGKSGTGKASTTDQARGGKNVCRTPHIDRLTDDAVEFSRAYTPCSLCSPARASMFTGRYAFNHGMGTNCDMYHSLSVELQHPEMLLHTRMQEAGYRCGFAGKWHVGTEKGPGDYGFEGMNLPGYGRILEDPGFNTYLKKHNLSFTPEPQYYLNPDRQTLIGGKWGGPVESTPAHYLSDYTMNMMDAYADADDPFCITCQFWGPHGPHMPSDEFYGLHDRTTLQPWESLHEDMRWKPRRIARELASFYRNHPRDWTAAREIVGLYYDTVAMLDYEVGRLLTFLEERGLAENTIVVFSTDHGDMTGAHGGMMDKGLLYEEAHHIPLLISWKGTLTPHTCHDLVMNMDIMPTLMDLAGIPVPADLDALSLKDSLLQKPDRPTRSEVYLEYHGLRFLYSQRALVTDDNWKYIFTPGDFDEVYDLNTDPAELHNLLAAPEFDIPGAGATDVDDSRVQAKIQELQDRMRAVSAEFGDPLKDCISKFFGVWYTGSRQVDASKFYDAGSRNG